MNVAKIGLAIGVMLLASRSLYAQEFKVAADNSKEGELVLTNFVGETNIVGYSGTEIVVTAGGEDMKLPDNAKGLKRVYPGGTDNTGIGLNMTKSGSTITIDCLLPIGHSGTYTVKVPNNLKLNFSTECSRGGTVNVSNMSAEVDIKSCYDISLTNVTGPLVLSTISGNIKVAFTQVSKDRPISIANISGDIDVTLPASTPTTLEMSNISGNMFSDFEFPRTTDKDMKKVGGGSIKANLNGGGVPLKLTNISGNIYLRKG